MRHVLGSDRTILLAAVLVLALVLFAILALHQVAGGGDTDQSIGAAARTDAAALLAV